MCLTRVVAIGFFLSVLTTSLFAEGVVLKSGERVEGKIVYRIDQFIQINSQGKLLTISYEDIERIDEIAPHSARVQDRKRQDIKRGIDKIEFLYGGLVRKRADYAYEGKQLTAKRDYGKINDNFNEEIRLINTTALRMRFLWVPSACKKLKDAAVKAIEVQVGPVKTAKDISSHSQGGVDIGTDAAIRINNRLKAELGILGEAVRGYESERARLMNEYNISEGKLSGK